MGEEASRPWAPPAARERMGAFEGALMRAHAVTNVKKGRTCEGRHNRPRPRALARRRPGLANGRLVAHLFAHCE
ncbi:hypothetical protein TRAPUB_512 [Trametes pubescens]|uniref:Uncharacterized protein n=1 Tax=Trametes pubescens TaxID=154538 RepID=A0A1M2VLW3_TRAPU|nr:hypothetical protein TRAPUB_512 [Trametes pubescens]